MGFFCGFFGFFWVGFLMPTLVWYVVADYLFSFFLRHHKADRVASFFSSSLIGTFPLPHTQANVPPPPLVPGEGILACGRGSGEVPFRTRGQTLWYSMYICTLCATPFYQSNVPIANLSVFVAVDPDPL